MFKSLEVFRMAHAMAVHAGTRQAAVAQNVANADTPGYRPMDVTPFAQFYKGQPGRFSTSLRATRAEHLGGLQSEVSIETSRPDKIPDPNDNSVSIEQEMLKAVEVRRQHDRAIAIYKSNLGLLRTAIGRG